MVERTENGLRVSGEIMKVITMYLPQFHRVKENDEWWGEGFTEWTAVKKAEKIFETHYQPRIPLNSNYYNLLDKNTMEWQAELMKKYGVDGQCFYHYWFKDGKQILEKPAEKLLCWKEIDMPFCFCWANETWARTWSNISSKNTWASILEGEAEKKGTGILLEQKYGSKEQWKEHFDYLLPFFKDERYIKINNSPVFVIYKTSLIYCLGEMVLLWEKWAKEEGFNGIYLIGANSNKSCEQFLNAVLFHEPQHTVGNMSGKDCGRADLLRLDYDKVWKELLEFKSVSSNVIYGGFVGYDDTPRRGKGGVVIDNATPVKFRSLLSELIAKNVAAENEIIFLNAWNEWGEGMHLEPDEKYGYAFLEAVCYAKSHYKEYLPKYATAYNNIGLVKEIESLTIKNARYESYWRVLDRWMQLREEEKSLEGWFLLHDIKSIAVYGMGMLGKHLLKELENGSIEIVYGIDRRKDMTSSLKIYAPDDEWPDAEAIVVTATYAFTEIAEQLKAKGYEKVISLEEVIMEMI